MSYLTLQDINKIYPNGCHAVHNFNLETGKGEFIVFVGPSGCGKSTTLRMIAGLEDKAILKVDPHDTPEIDSAITFSIPHEEVYLFTGEPENVIEKALEKSR